MGDSGPCQGITRARTSFALARLETQMRAEGGTTDFTFLGASGEQEQGKANKYMSGRCD
jgi:hypothetical protein